MKRTFFGIAVAVPFLLALSTSCSDPIFSSIREEVELEDADVSGAIYSIVRFGNDLYTQNGKIYRKLGENMAFSHNWETFSVPPVSSDYPYVNKLAADETYLYAQITKINEDEEEGENVAVGSEVWCWDGEEWWPLVLPGDEGGEGETLSASSFGVNSATLFCTNAVQPEHRKAYLNHAGTIYCLSGSSAEVVLTGESDNTTEPTASSRNCAYFDGQVYFTSEAAMTTNETSGSDATRMYRVYGGDAIYFMDSDGEWTKWTDIGYSVFTLSVTNGDTGESGMNAVIAGTASGIWILVINKETGSCEGDYTSSFKNASSTLSSYYRIHASLVANPSQPLDESAIYASADYSGSSSNTSASTKNRGLWSYLGETRKSWNRE